MWQIRFSCTTPTSPKLTHQFQPQVQEGFIDDEDEEAEDSDERERRRRRKRRRAERDEEAQLDEEDLDLIGEANPEFQSREQPKVRLNTPYIVMTTFVTCADCCYSPHTNGSSAAIAMRTVTTNDPLNWLLPCSRTKTMRVTIASTPARATAAPPLTNSRIS